MRHTPDSGLSVNGVCTAYYEETPFHPEWLLEDLIKIFHPDVAKAEGGRYFRKLAD